MLRAGVWWLFIELIAPALLIVAYFISAFTSGRTRGGRCGVCGSWRGSRPVQKPARSRWPLRLPTTLAPTVYRCGKHRMTK